MHVAKLITTSVTGIALAFSMLASTLPANAASGFHAAYFSESDFLARNAGETGQFAVGYTNTGDQAWIKGAAGQQANLGTAAPLDNTTDFTAGWANGWLSANRYTAQNAALVAPGQIGFFIYNFTVPAGAAAGEHRFFGRPVIDGVTFMEDYGYYQSAVVGGTSTAPMITSLTPNTGSSAGGTSVVIAGTGFVCNPTLPAVNFGAGNAGTVTSCGASSLTVTSPAHAVGTASVTVTNSGGVASTGLDYIYADTTAPVFNSITASGNSITLMFSKAVCSTAPLATTTDIKVTVNGFGTAINSQSSTACNTTFDNGTTAFDVTVATPFTNGDAVSLTLTTAGGLKLRDTAGNTTSAQTRTATAVGDTTKPFMTAAAAKTTTTLLLTYSQAVTCAAAAGTEFSVTPSGGSNIAGTTAACAILPAGSTSVTVTFPASTFASGVGGSVTYTEGANPVTDRVGNKATTPQGISYAALSTDTIRPLSQDIRIKTKTGSSSTLNTGDVFTVAFNEVMTAPVNPAFIRFTDADGTVADVVCGTSVGVPVGSTATCALSTAATTIGGVSYPLGQVITVTLYANPTIVTAGTIIGLQLPATVVDSTGWTDADANSWDVANSPDKLLN